LKGQTMTQAQAKAKSVNYTEEQTAAVVTAYQAGESVDAIAAKMGKTTRSIVAKLSREGVYKAKEKAAGEKAANIGKADLAANIAKAGNMTADEAKDLQKLTKQTLVNLYAAVAREAVNVVCNVDAEAVAAAQ
jgi:acetylglutamate kinase